MEDHHPAETLPVSGLTVQPCRVFHEAVPFKQQGRVFTHDGQQRGGKLGFCPAQKKIPEQGVVLVILSAAGEPFREQMIAVQRREYASGIRVSREFLGQMNAEHGQDRGLQQELPDRFVGPVEQFSGEVVEHPLIGEVSR